MRLISDIGGTYARFALADKHGNISEVKKFLKKDYPTVAEAIVAYKNLTAQNFDEVVLAINAPVNNGVPFINSHNWGYEQDLTQALGISKIMYFNDLQSHAMALPFLKNDEKVQVHGKSADPKGTIAVIGPGTGLGLAYGTYNEDFKQHHFHSSEGGNQLASATNLDQLDLIRKLLKLMPSVRWEDISSGRGIHSVYKALYHEEKHTDDIMKEFAQGSEKSKEVFKYFCEFLGLFTHNTGITFLPYGGIYIVGGILTRAENIDFLIKDTDFLKYYNSADLYDTAYLENFPIYLVTHFNPALLGLANYKFGL